MLVLSWIATVLAYAGGGAFLAVGLIDPNMLGETITLVDCIIGFVVLFIGLGFLGHFFATKALSKKRSGAGLAVWIISFIPYILPSLVIVVVVQVLRVVDLLVYLGFNTHIIAQVVNTITEFLIGKQFKVFAGAGTIYDEGTKISTEDYYIVQTTHGDRKLRVFDHCTDNIPDSPYYLKCYVLYKDDIGNYWRSYDDGHTFIEDDKFEHY